MNLRPYHNNLSLMIDLVRKFTYPVELVVNVFASNFAVAK